VPPNTYSPITIKTFPGADCAVQPAAGETPNTNLLHFFADRQGNARFFVRPTESSDEIAQLTVQCSAFGRVMTQIVEVRASTASVAGFPFPPPPPEPIGQIRPGLSESQALRLSPVELLRLGYPPRPNPEDAEATRIWLDEVTGPVTIVKPLVIPNPYIRHNYGDPQSRVEGGPRSFYNWSGVDLAQPAGTFNVVRGSWIVPSVTGELNQNAQSLTWVGIDGDPDFSPNDLAQAGTGQDARRVLFPGAVAGLPPSVHLALDVASYHAWTELLPNQPCEQWITFSVAPGDQISTAVSIGGNVMIASITNITHRRTTGLLYTSLGSFFDCNETPIAAPGPATTVVGTTAEWIMERPCISACDSSPVYSDLADFGDVTVFLGASASNERRTPMGLGLEEITNFGCCGSGSSLIDMINSGTLATVDLDGGTINFHWKAFH
jgi:hypothetical protein